MLEMPIEDLRGEGYKLIDTQLFMDVLRILPPLINSKSTNQRKFEEMDPPEKMRGRTADLDRLECLIKPDQLTVDAISDKIPRAQVVPPPCTPYPTDDFLASPWIPNEPEHIRRQEGRVARHPGGGI